MPRPRVLLVAPNPFCSLDADGDPAGYVARVDLRPLLVGAERELRNRVLKLRFDLTPIEVPDLPAYRMFLRTGQLLPGDKATAERVEVAWSPLATQLPECARRAAERFQAETGELPAWVTAPIVEAGPDGLLLVLSPAAPAAPTPTP